jgi:hypothetical protein
MDNTDPLDGYDDLNESEQYILEQELLNRAFTNSFNLITKRKKMKDIVNESGGLLLSHDPFSDLFPDDLINMLDFFIEEEDYEKCAEVRDYINDLKRKHARKQKEDSTKELSEVLNNIIRGAKSRKKRNS